MQQQYFTQVLSPERVNNRTQGEKLDYMQPESKSVTVNIWVKHAYPGLLSHKLNLSNNIFTFQLIVPSGCKLPGRIIWEAALNI